MTLTKKTIGGEEVKKFKLELESCSGKHCSTLQQKSRITWLKKGDRNNKFFDQAIQKRIHRNSIKSIVVGEFLVSIAEEIKKAFLNHFRGLYNKHQVQIPEVGSCVERRIIVTESLWLERNFMKFEIDLALSELANNKSPGLDGFNLYFIKFFWKNLSGQVLECFSKFWASGMLPKGFNSSFIALIPKKSHPKLIQDYTPINLINSISKLLTKVLANRMIVLNNKLFDDYQNRFIKGRHAAKSILLVHEVHHSIKLDSNKCMILKLDFEKAFDTVR